MTTTCSQQAWVCFETPGIHASMGQNPGHCVCSGSVVVTAYDFESGRPGSNPEWG